MQFKIGDKVKIVRYKFNRNIYGHNFLPINTIGTIIFIGYSSGEPYCKLDIENNATYNGGFWLEEVELVEKKVIKPYGIVEFMRSI